MKFIKKLEEARNTILKNKGANLCQFEYNFEKYILDLFLESHQMRMSFNIVILLNIPKRNLNCIKLIVLFYVASVPFA